MSGVSLTRPRGDGLESDPLYRFQDLEDFLMHQSIGVGSLLVVCYW